MLSRDEILAQLQEAGVYRIGHFQLTSGRHSREFFLLPHLFQYPALTERMAAELAAKVADLPVETVVGPATGGIILASEVARQIGKLRGDNPPGGIFA
ncbi:MAG: hypothetical protein ACM3XM_03905 [Mycobacterium leprae]